MTHNPHLKPQNYDWKSCWMERYPSNNGVVLMWAPSGKGDHRTDVLVFIAGADIGTDPNDFDETVFGRVEPIFKAIIHTHNRAYEMGHEDGSRAARLAIQKAIGVLT